jgi:epoxyqueuosine reductase
MTPAERTHWIGERARALGFHLCGVAPVESEDAAAAPDENHSRAGVFAELQHLPEWLARGYAGEMKYLHDPRRSDPRLILRGARSLIVVAINYNSPHPHSFESRIDESDCAGNSAPRGWISRYAWGDDYHELIQEKLRSLIAEMRAQFPEPFEARSYVDTGPIVERVAAKYAGLGWLAKNTCLINSKLGSWLFLGVIVTTLVLEPTLAPGEAPPADLCGTCTRCLDACPTQAFPEPYVLDARRCISYLTIELRDAIPENIRAQMGANVIGCDVCQDVCPWNRKAPVTSMAAFQPRAIVETRNFKAETEDVSALQLDDRISTDEFPISFFAPELEWLTSLSQQEFSAAFRGSAVKRAKWRGLVRNACVALGNSGVAQGAPAYPRVVRLLDRLAASEDALISSHARWALAQLSTAAAPLETTRKTR